MGERTPVALLDSPASGRLAVGEAITNIAATRIGALQDIKMSANWMCAAGHKGEDEKLYRTVEAVGMELCPALGITIPVGKDSMSMSTAWQEESGENKAVTSPMSLVITAFAPVMDVRKTVTPELRTDCGMTDLILIDLGRGKNRLGATILTQVYEQLGETPANVDSAEDLKAFFNTMQLCLENETLLAYHDRGDGGLFATVAEMAFAGHCGVDLHMSEDDAIAALFNEELGAVLQTRRKDTDAVIKAFSDAGLEACVTKLGELNDEDLIRIENNKEIIFDQARSFMQVLWSETSYRIQSLRDNADCAQQEFDNILSQDPGLSAHLSYSQNEDVAAPYINTGVKPSVAILREQGVNGHIEMGAAFDRAGFTAVDVHMSDILAGRVNLSDFKGLAACGGFSYGDVLGAGEGWAKSVLFNSIARDQFEGFFTREDTFTLGVCNGCQMMSNLKGLIPGAEHWPRFVRNQSEQFEARSSLVQVQESNSVLFQGMAGSHMPVAVAHGEGLAEFESAEALQSFNAGSQVALRFVDNHVLPTERYPANPNGSPTGITSVTSTDGRATIMMPHPERVFRAVTNSWCPEEWDEDGAWLRIFRNARVFVG